MEFNPTFDAHIVVLDNTIGAESITSGIVASFSNVIKLVWELLYNYMSSRILKIY